MKMTLQCFHRRRRLACAPTQHTLCRDDKVHPNSASAPMDADLEAEIARVHALALGANSAADEAIEDVVAAERAAGRALGRRAPVEAGMG